MEYHSRLQIRCSRLATCHFFPCQINTMPGVGHTLVDSQASTRLWPSRGASHGCALDSEVAFFCSFWFKLRPLDRSKESMAANVVMAPRSVTESEVRMVGQELAEQVAGFTGQVTREVELCA